MNDEWRKNQAIYAEGGLANGSIVQITCDLATVRDILYKVIFMEPKRYVGHLVAEPIIIPGNISDERSCLYRIIPRLPGQDKPGDVTPYEMYPSQRRLSSVDATKSPSD